MQAMACPMAYASTWTETCGVAGALQSLAWMGFASSHLTVLYWTH